MEVKPQIEPNYAKLAQKFKPKANPIIQLMAFVITVLVYSTLIVGLVKLLVYVLSF